MTAAEEESIWRLIGTTGQAIRNYADQRLKQYDLTVEQLQVLKQTHLDHGQAQHRLCTAAGKSPANITRILDRLERKKRIVRRKNPRDRRSSLVFLTEEGAQLRDEVLQLFETLREELFAGVTVDEQRTAVGVLRLIRENINKMSAG